MAISLLSLSNEQLLIAGLDALTARDLISQPPAAVETMQHIGISKTNLDGPVRSWVNKRFRANSGKQPLRRGAIKPSTRWAQLLTML